MTTTSSESDAPATDLSRIERGMSGLRETPRDADAGWLRRCRRRRRRKGTRRQLRVPFFVRSSGSDACFLPRRQLRVPFFVRSSGSDACFLPRRQRRARAPGRRSGHCGTRQVIINSVATGKVGEAGPGCFDQGSGRRRKKNEGESGTFISLFDCWNWDGGYKSFISSMDSLGTRDVLYLVDIHGDVFFIVVCVVLRRFSSFFFRRAGGIVTRSLHLQTSSVHPPHHQRLGVQPFVFRAPQRGQHGRAPRTLGHPQERVVRQLLPQISRFATPCELRSKS